MKSVLMRKDAMKRTSTTGLLLLLMCGSSAAQTQTPSQNKSVPQTYTTAEYNAYQAAAAEKDPARLVILVDDFLSRYPESPLLVYVYPLCSAGYGQLKNYPKVFECADKLVVQLGDKADVAARYAALYTAATAYNKMDSSDSVLAARARKMALTGVELLRSLRRPDLLDERGFEEEKKRAAIYLQATAGRAAIEMKDYRGATNAFRAVIALDAVGIVTSR